MDLIQTDSIERLFHRQESQQTLICLPPGDVFTVRFILILQNKRAPARNPAPLKHEKKHPQKGAACQGFVLSAGTGSQRTALTIASVTGASGAPEEGLLKVELGDGIMLIPHHLKHRVYPHTRTIPVTDPECRFPIILYRNKGTDNPAADLFYRKMCKAFRT